MRTAFYVFLACFVLFAPAFIPRDDEPITNNTYQTYTDNTDKQSAALDRYNAEQRTEQPDMPKSIGEYSITYYADVKACQGEYVGQTSTGVEPIVGVTIAVDPKVIAYGSVVYIKGIGKRIAQDCGGAIKGREIDVLVSSRAEALRLGRHESEVYIVD